MVTRLPASSSGASAASTALLPLVPTIFLSSSYQASRMSSFLEERKKVRPSGFFLSAAISLNWYVFDCAGHSLGR